MLCFFFKQKTAYEMRISDWSSDVCSSDLADAGRRADGGLPRDATLVADRGAGGGGDGARFACGRSRETARRAAAPAGYRPSRRGVVDELPERAFGEQRDRLSQIGRASCRERVCQYG